MSTTNIQQQQSQQTPERDGRTPESFRQDSGFSGPRSDPQYRAVAESPNPIRRRGSLLLPKDAGPDTPLDIHWEDVTQILARG